MLRRARLRTFAAVIGAVLLFIVLLSQLRGRYVDQIIPAGTPPVVVVTVIDPGLSKKYNQMIIDNRREYAAMHGYATFFPKHTDYNLGDPPSPSSWSKLPAMRHAMTSHPFSTYFFFLDHHALIMNPSLSIEHHIMDPARLESLMLPDKPIVPPDSIIKTFHTRDAAAIDLVVAQDSEGLAPASFILRRGAWAQFFLDAWFDALYRSYNFQKAEAHALEHLVQWHSTVLSRLALVPQRTLNSYTQGQGQEQYKDGDFVAHLHGCDKDAVRRSCESEALPLYEHFVSSLRSLQH